MDYEKRIRELTAELNVLKGIGLTVGQGCALAEMCFGDATVLVEFEITKASGDGWNEPRTERDVQPISVFVNGCWIDAQDCVPERILENWRVQFLEDEADADGTDADEAWERRRDMLMDDLGFPSIRGGA